jgi:hypothetical protein
MKTIYIHIGGPKTGSTSVQSFATFNQKPLLERDVFYPLIGRSFAGPMGKLFINGHIFIDRMICSEGINTITLRDNCQLIANDLCRTFDNSGCSKMLISEEALFFGFNGTLSTICDLFNKSKYKLKIIVYLRNICEYSSGLWKEDIKSGIWKQSIEFNPDNTIDLESSMRLKAASYLESLKMLESLSEKIGKENIIIRTFEKERWINNDLVDDFLSILNIKNNKKLQKIGDVNVGISREMVENYAILINI